MSQDPQNAVSNAAIADMFDETANLLTFEDANPFRIRAYRRGALTVRNTTEPMAELIEQGFDLTKLPTIGDDLAALIDEAVRTGRMRSLEDLRRSTPAITHDLLEIEGIGPRKARALWQELGVANIEQLHRAVLDHRVSSVPGFGAASEKRLAAALGRVLHPVTGRMPLALAEPIALDLLSWLKAAPSLSKLDVAGSFRRGRDTVGDIDIVAAASNHRAVIEHFIKYPQVADTISAGEQRASVRLAQGIDADLRVVHAPSYGAALQYFTGSRDHSIRLRTLAKQQGLKLNEYGLWRGKKLLAGQDEAGIYKQLGLQFIPPELRENRGEIELAQAGKISSLIEEDDVAGDLHLIVERPEMVSGMIEAAAKKGWRYIGIGPRVSSNDSMQPSLEALFKAIAGAAKAHPKLKVYSIIEVDILKDGRLDLPDYGYDADIIIGSVQNGFRLSREQQTERLVRAITHPALSILSHPTGRRAAQRAPYDVNLTTVAAKAAECGVALELSADPDRLDLSAWGCKIACETGAMISIGSEAQSADALDRMALGVKQARRGWLERENVLNALPASDVDRFISRHAAISAVLEPKQA